MKTPRIDPVSLNLATLDHMPSWVNRAGRVDRSACLALSVSDVWRLVTFHRSRTGRAISERARRRGSSARTHREAVARLLVTAEQLLAIHRRQSPRQLSGDWRGARSNPMRGGASQEQRYVADPGVFTPGCDGADTHRNTDGVRDDHDSPRCTSRGAREEPRGRPRSSHEAERDVFTPSYHGSDMARDRWLSLPANPNKGASRSKMLGLPVDFTQCLTIERWRQHARLAQHFFRCGLADDGAGGCGRKVAKLFLPLCTAAERRDADLAQAMLRRWRDEHPNKPLPVPLVAVIDRYGALFHPRSLRCRHCLGLRYGEALRQRDRERGVRSRAAGDQA